MPAKLAIKANACKSWRDVLKVHPAAELFPLMGEAELKELAEDIKKTGLKERITLWPVPETDVYQVLDGRNRLDALALNGTDLFSYGKPRFGDIFASIIGDDQVAYIISKNIHRRHLTPEQRREVIAGVLKLNPEKSDRQIGKMVKRDHKTVAKERRKQEDVGTIPHVAKRIDTKGRKQPASKPKTVEDTSQTDDMVCTRGDDGVDVWSVSQPEVSVEQRRAEMAALADAIDPGTAEDARHEPAGKAYYAATEEAADKSEHKAPSTKDIALSEFNNHVLRLLQITSKAKPERFAKTAVRASDLSQLGRFLAGVLHEDQDIVERALQVVQQMDAEQRVQFLAKLEARYGAEMPVVEAAS